jgi:hypothetical protein
VKVDIALSKASRAQDGERFLLEEIENLGKSMQCKSFELFHYPLSAQNSTFYLFLQVCASTALLKPDM